MWVIFGVAAIVFAVLNLIRASKNRSTKWFRFTSMAFTALTLCEFYSQEALRVTNADWAGLTDVMPSTSKLLWVCTIMSILINSLSLFKKKK